MKLRLILGVLLASCFIASPLYAQGILDYTTSPSVDCDNDWVYLVDVSVTTDNASGSNAKAHPCDLGITAVIGDADYGDIVVSSTGTVMTIDTGVILNADINASAAIALSKLAATTTSRALVSDGSGFISAATTTATEIGYVNGVTSAIQTQLNAKQGTLTNSAGLAAAISDESGTGSVVYTNSPTLVTPALGTIASGVGTALTALNGENIQDDTIDDDSIDFADITLADITFDVGSVDTTEFGYLNGVTSAIQTQLGNKAARAQTFQWSGMIETPDNKTYHISVDTAYAGAITEVVTDADSGTGTWTCSINGTPLGGTANSVSSTEQAQAHASSNSFSAGDEITCAISSNSSLDDMRFKIEYTRTLAQ